MSEGEGLEVGGRKSYELGPGANPGNGLRPPETEAFLLTIA